MSLVAQRFDENGISLTFGGGLTITVTRTQIGNLKATWGDNATVNVKFREALQSQIGTRMDAAAFSIIFDGDGHPINLIRNEQAS